MSAGVSDWVVDLRLHTVSGLPEFDPDITLNISSPGDEQCKWSTASHPSLRGTAFLGAWTTIIVRGSDTLTLEVAEEISAIQIFKWSRFKARTSVNLRDHAEDAELGGESVDLVLTLLPLGSQKQISDATKTKHARVNKTAEVDNTPENSTDSGSSSSPGSSLKEESGSEIEPTPSQPSEKRLTRSTAGFSLFKPVILRLRLSLKVVSLAVWEAQEDAYHSRGAALEMPITPLPSVLQSYAHGGFMGLACSIGEDPKWREILRKEDPASWHAWQLAAAKADLKDKLNLGRPGTAQGSLMTALENSPVLCAFGLVRSGCTSPVTSTTADTNNPREGPPLTKLERVLSASASRKKLEGIRQIGRAALLTAPLPQEMSPLAKDASREHPASPATRAALGRYHAAMSGEGAYGYKPMPLEWDVWLHPRKPWSLAGASIAHGTPAALLTQAVTTSLGLNSLARKAGRRQITGRDGLSPAAWLTQLGNSINIAVNGDKDIPLPLHGEEGACWRLVIEIESVEGINPKIWRKVEVSGDVDSNDVVLPVRRTVAVPVESDGTAAWRRDATTEWLHAGKPAVYSEFAAADKGDLEGYETHIPTPRPRPPRALPHRYLTFWPLPLELAYDDVLLTVNGFTPVLNTRLGCVLGPPLARRKTVGMARLRLEELVRQHPSILEGEDVRMEIEIGCVQPRKVNVVRPHAVPGDERPEGSPEGEEEDYGSDDGSEGDEEITLTLSEVQELFSEGNKTKKEEKKKEKLLAWWRGEGSRASSGNSKTSGNNSKRSVFLDTNSATSSEDGSDDELDYPASAIAALGCTPEDILTNFRPAHAHKPHNPRIRVRVSMEEVPVIEAMQNLGVPRAAAQSAVVMLSQPGGLYLDIKSAYSTPCDLQLFVSSLRGIGITTKAVCSFKPEQLHLGPIADTVLYFHGLAGLENACDSGMVPPGQFVLFNGASLLTDFKPKAFKHMSHDVAEQAVGDVTGWPLDTMSLRKYHNLADMYGIIGGLYIQEPDAAPAGIDSLCQLVSEHPEYFPLGFAYGAVSGRAVTWLDAKGRGFANQQMVEELAARKDLAKKAVRRIAAGEHVGASLSTSIVLAGWLVRGGGWISYAEQRAMCMLLAEVHPKSAVAALVAEIGGIEMLVTRFHLYYEMITPLTLLESGWNWGFTKSLLRLLRNQGVMAALTLQQKVDLAKFFRGPALYGYGLTYLLQMLRLRRGLHKHAKEGMLCLLESCTAEEVKKIISSLGGQAKVELLLHGWLRLSWQYNARLHDVIETHKADPRSLAYTNPVLKYAALPSSEKPSHPNAGQWDFKAAAHAATHTRNKSGGELAARWARRSACCVFTLGYTVILELLSLLMFLPCCVVPRVVGIPFKGGSRLAAVMVTSVVFIGCFIAGVFLLLRFVIDEHGNVVAPGLG